MADHPYPISGSLASLPGATSFARVPDHELIRLIGKGSYGEVWLARNALGACRAIKIVYEQTFRHRRPFEREFHGVQKFEPISRSHEGLMDVLQVGRNEEAGYFYCVMELADDVASGQVIDPANYSPRTLAFDIAKLKRLPLEECRRVVAAIASALDFLHSRGLIHRDIKPSNIVFVNGVPKLADIGLVAEMSEAKSYVGTEGFIPPEGPGTVQADIYSLGKVLYEISTGKDRHDYPDLPTGMGDPVQEKHAFELNKITLKACRTDPKERYQSAEGMLADLLALQRGESLPVRKVSTRRIQRIAAILGCLAALIVVAWLIGLRSEFGTLQQANAGKSPPFAPVPPGLIAWWQAEQNALDFLDKNSGSLKRGTSYTDGKVGHSFSFAGEGQVVEIPDSTALNPTNLTLEAWVFLRSYPAKGGAILVGKNRPYGEYQYLLSLNGDQRRCVFQPLITTTMGIVKMGGNTAIQTNTWHHVAMTYDGSLLKLYVDGKLDGVKKGGGPVNTTTQPLVIGGGQVGFQFCGCVDELSLYDRALEAGEIRNIYTAGESGKRLLPPVVTKHPQNQVLPIGDHTRFDVAFESSTPASCQWSLNRHLIPGATNAFLILSNLQYSDAGNYSVALSNPGGSATSSNAVLVVVAPASLTHCTVAAESGSIHQVGLSTAITNGPGIASWSLQRQYCEQGFTSSFRFRIGRLESALKPGPGSKSISFFIQSADLDPGFISSTNSLQVSLNISNHPQSGIRCEFVEITGEENQTAFHHRLDGIDLTQTIGEEHTMQIHCLEGYLDLAVDGTQLVTNLPVPLASALSKDGYAQIGIHAEPSDMWGPDDISDWSFCCATAPTSHVAPTGLVAWWRADGDALDSVQGNNGALRGTGFCRGRIGQAFCFDGTNNFVEVPDSPSLRFTNELTIEFWVKRLRSDESVEFCLEKGGDWTTDQQNYGVALNRESYNFCLSFCFAGGWRGAGCLSDSLWHHCAIVARNGDTDPKFYINGVLQPVIYTEGDPAIHLYPSKSPLHLGAQIDPAGKVNYFGKIAMDDVAIYDRALSAVEIQAIYNAGSAGKSLPRNHAGVKRHASPPR